MDANNDDAERGRADAWRQWIGRTVVVDTDSQYIYLGRLAGADASWILLEDVDVHDIHETHVTRERYLIEAVEIGLKPNRKAAWVLRERVVGVSALDDILRF